MEKVENGRLTEESRDVISSAAVKGPFKAGKLVTH